MTTSTQFRSTQEIVPSAMIEKKVRELSRNIGIATCICSWKAAQGIGKSSLHCLRICADGRTAQIYFTDHELAGYWNGPSTRATDTRLEHVFDELVDNNLPSDFSFRMQATDLPSGWH